jgi:hypothetical protein
MRNLHRIAEAIADLERQEAPNVKATAEKYDIERTTLRNRQIDLNGGVHLDSPPVPRQRSGEGFNRYSQHAYQP